MGYEEPMVRHASSVAQVVQLGHDALELDASRAERQGEVIVAVRARADDQPFECGRSPVAVERPEEQLTEPPAGVHVRLGGATRDDTVLLAVVVWIVLESRVEVGVGDDGDGAEQRLDGEAAGGSSVPRSGWPQGVAPRLTRACGRHVAIQSRPRLVVGGRPPQSGENGAYDPSLRATEPCRVGGGERTHYVGLDEGPAQRARIAGHTAGDAVPQIRRGPVPE